MISKKNFSISRTIFLTVGQNNFGNKIQFLQYYDINTTLLSPVLDKKEQHFLDSKCSVTDITIQKEGVFPFNSCCWHYVCSWVNDSMLIKKGLLKIILVLKGAKINGKINSTLFQHKVKQLKIKRNFWMVHISFR